MQQTLRALFSLLTQLINGTSHFVEAYEDVGKMAKESSGHALATMKEENAQQLAKLTAKDESSQ